MKCSVYIATSLDGFIARQDGGLDWLNQFSADSDADSGAEDYGYHDFIQSVDYLVMGRGTYETVLSFGGDWPYGDKRIVVLSSRKLVIPEAIAGTVELMRGAPIDIVTHLATRGAAHLYVDGGITIQRFLDAGLIDELIISTIPILIGQGIPLFGPLAGDVKVRLLESKSYASGLVQSRYAVRDKSHGQ